MCEISVILNNRQQRLLILRRQTYRKHFRTGQARLERIGAYVQQSKAL